MTRIVLADDHAFMRSGVAGVLDALGMVVAASVENGAAALDAIANENPDLVIMDLRMPVMSGLDALTAMRENGDVRPVIILAAEIDDESLLGILRAKVNGVIFKQGAETRLETAIAQVLRGERFIEIDVIERALGLAMADRKPARNRRS
jgi:two-component system nitrate/nitrite response regulator NarP